MSESYAIELKNITKRFGKVTANDKVCLSVKKGEILSILGENGSGKTTLMNMISGIYYPDEGQILVNGKEVTIRSPKDSFALGIGMIHQHFKLVDVLTAAENIILGLSGKEILDMKSVAAKINELTSRYGFDLDPNQKIYTMSVSQKQTVEIVKLLYRGVDQLIRGNAGDQAHKDRGSDRRQRQQDHEQRRHADSCHKKSLFHLTPPNRRSRAS